MTNQARKFATIPTRDAGMVPPFMRQVIADEPPASERVVAEQAVLALNASMLSSTTSRWRSSSEHARPSADHPGAVHRPGRKDDPVSPRAMLPRSRRRCRSSTSSPSRSATARWPSMRSVAVPGQPGGEPAVARPSPMFRTQNQTALESLGALDISEDDRAVLRAILERNLAFMDECLEQGNVYLRGVEKYIRDCTPFSVKTIGIGSGAQVGHWMRVVEGWKKSLGQDWEHTYGVSNSLYITRQNNILFSVLVQFMGTEAMGDRLLFIETPEFETTPEKLLDVLTRIVADRGSAWSSSGITSSWTSNCSAAAAGPRSSAR